MSSLCSENWGRVQELKRSQRRLNGAAMRQLHCDQVPGATWPWLVHEPEMPRAELRAAGHEAERRLEGGAYVRFWGQTGHDFLTPPPPNALPISSSRYCYFAWILLPKSL